MRKILALMGSFVVGAVGVSGCYDDTSVAIGPADAAAPKPEAGAGDGAMGDGAMAPDGSGAGNDGAAGPDAAAGDDAAVDAAEGDDAAVDAAADAPGAPSPKPTALIDL